MTDALDFVRVAVAAPIGNSDHSSLSAVISMAQAVSNWCVINKVFLEHKVNWDTVCGVIQVLPKLTFDLLTILLTFTTSICCCWWAVLFQPWASVCSTRKSLGLMINAGLILASSRRGDSSSVDL